MRTALRILLAVGCLGMATSCYYGAYDYGYSSSYGFSNGGSTSFIYTNSDRWLYDSTVRCYYDRTRHCYYDPWVGGYYPRGYCPPVVRGVPHPYGWNGRGRCPTPRNVRSGYINRHHDRLGNLRSTNHHWASGIRNGGSAHGQAWRNNRAQAAANHCHPGSQGQVGQHRPTPRAPIWQNGNQNRNTPPGVWNQRGGRQPNIRPGGQPTQPGAFGRGGSRGAGASQGTRQRPGFNQPVNTPRPPAVRPQPTPQTPTTPSGNVFDRRRAALQALQNRLTR